MSDNVFNFPKPHLNIEVELEDLKRHEELVEACHMMFEIHAAGMVHTSDVNWEHIMDAALSLGIGAGLRAGITPAELEDALADVCIEEIEYDA